MASSPDLSPDNMTTTAAAVVVVNKRYRPSPAKTFQCRGYGECRMVFSRSEHLARHIRKHTGERPFSCHCSKQFSRLDNLRQHAQTVHADKQEDNERMMRELTSLHATMSAANKLGGRVARKTSTMASSSPMILIKQEEMANQRPDTSTGYEGAGFRDQSSQSFLAPHSQSFRAFSRLNNNNPTGSSPRPLSSSGIANSQHPRSLPPLASIVSTTLPSPPQQQQQHQHQQQHQQQSVLSFHHRSSSVSHRPGTAPASASLFAPSSFHDRLGRSRLGSSNGRPDLSLLHSGFSGRSLGLSDHLHHQFNLGELPNSAPNDSSPFFFNPPVPSISDPTLNNPRKRPFSGPHGPSDDSDQLRSDRPTSSAPPFSDEYGSESRPQSRRLTVMELCNDNDQPPPPQPRPPSQRREQSSGSYVLSNDTSSRPTTSSGLVSSTSTLQLFDHPASPGPTQQNLVLSRTSYPTASSVGDGPTGGRGPPEGGRPGSGPPPSSTAPPTFSNTTTSPSTPSPVLLPSSKSPNAAPTQRQQRQYQPYPKHHSPQYFPHSPTFSTPSGASNDSCSPRSSPLSDCSAGSPFHSYAHPSTRSSSSTVYASGHIASAHAHSGSGISAQSHHLHHHHQRDAQVGASVSPHPASFGMRV